MKGIWEREEGKKMRKRQRKVESVIESETKTTWQGGVESTSWTGRQ